MKRSKQLRGIANWLEREEREGNLLAELEFSDGTSNITWTIEVLREVSDFMEAQPPKKYDSQEPCEECGFKDNTPYKKKAKLKGQRSCENCGNDTFFIASGGSGGHGWSDRICTKCDHEERTYGE